MATWTCQMVAGLSKVPRLKGRICGSLKAQVGSEHFYPIGLYLSKRTITPVQTAGTERVFLSWWWVERPVSKGMCTLDDIVAAMFGNKIYPCIAYVLKDRVCLFLTYNPGKWPKSNNICKPLSPSLEKNGASVKVASMWQTVCDETRNLSFYYVASP